jgi:hypothetical protein
MSAEFADTACEHDKPCAGRRVRANEKDDRTDCDTRMRSCGHAFNQTGNGMHIALATSADYPNLADWDRGVVDALRALGVVANPAIWTDATFDWSSVACAIVQSTWDSHLRPTEFLEWAERVERVTTLHNPASLLRWSMHKHYLRELAQRGVAITPTAWVARDTRARLLDLMQSRDWSRVVIKPTISAGANETHIVDASRIADGQAHLDRLTAQYDVMVQPYLESFESEGERAYIFFNGALSHAVHRPPTLKSAARSFDAAYAFEPTSGAELDLAHDVVAALDAVPLYARVDVATNNDGAVRLQELELIEPCLFTSLAPGAADRFARAILARL